MNLTRKNWPLGWCPSEDKRNGNPEALLKMQNLELDEKGIISLVKGCKKVNSSAFSTYIHSIYSKYLNNSKYRFVGLASGEVKCLDSNASEVFTIDGSLHNKTGFGSTFGQILITAGNVRKKWDGTNLRDLGLTKPIAPTSTLVTTINQPSIDLSNLSYEGTYSNWILGGPAGNDGYGLINNTNSVTFVCDPGAAKCGRVSVDSNTPLNAWNGIDGTGTPEDTFALNIRLGDTNQIKSVTLRFYHQAQEEDYPSLLEFYTQEELDSGAKIGSPTNYYQYEWVNDPTNSPFTYGLDVWSVLRAARKDFTRVGTHTELGWSDVVIIEITVRIDWAEITALVQGLKVTGGPEGPIYGFYDYAIQHVNNTGVYLAKSPLSDAITSIEIINGAAQITLTDPRGDDPQINEIWVFRRNSVPSDVIPLNEQQGLDTWYRVKKIVLGIDSLTFRDEVSDKDAIKENEIGNEFLISVKTIPEDIIDIETNYFTRTLYLTPKALYLSERNNPDLVDPRYTIIFAGNTTDINLWMVKASLGSLVIATTYDFYDLSGTLLDLPDGSLDAISRGIGSEFPALGYDVAHNSNFIFYVASDGVRTLSSSGMNELISAPLNLLFQDEERYGISPFFRMPRGIVAFPLTIAYGKLWVSLASQDYTRRLYVYDIIGQYWHNRYLFTTALYAEEDGTLLGGFGEGEGGAEAYLRVLNTGNTIDVSNWPSSYQSIAFLTVFDDNQQPRNRKDVFTLKITADTGNYPVVIWIGKDKESLISLGSFTFNGFDEQLIRLEGIIDPGMAYTLYITSNAVPTFKLYNFSIEYEPFPEQLNFYRIPNNNLGTFARKRVTNYAFVIDTLGNSITFTPLVDGSTLSGSTVTFIGKRTFIHYFKSETIGTDLGGLLSDGIFEYYGLNLEEIVSEKLPTPVKFLVIPNTDYGSPNRKRHSSYKFQINTRGYNIQYTPKIDGVDYTPATFNTSEKRTVEYFFSVDTIGIDIGGELESLTDEEFEFYGVIIPQQVEVLPPRLKEFRIPENNYGIASRKRIRTMPMEINTNGVNVTFTPIVDGVSGTPAIINTPARKTTFYYFETDSFGTDYSGELIGPSPFEFYGLLKPEEVEILPVAKKLDQIGPLRFDKLAKLLACRFRVIPQGSETLVLRFYDEEGVNLSIPIHTENVPVVGNYDEIYEFAFPKTVKGSTIRVVIGPSTLPFHRYDLQLKIALSGMETDPKWIKVK